MNEMRVNVPSSLAYSLAYLGVVAVSLAQGSPPSAGTDPFDFFRPSIDITMTERARLDHGDSLARVLPAKGLEVAVLAATPVGVDGNRLVAWERRIDVLKKSSYVTAIGRFTNPPRIEDLDGLTLDDADVNAIRSCRPGQCDLKLSSGEMGQLQAAETQSGSNPAEAVQRAFRQVILNRVKQYLADGSVPPDEDHRQEVQPSSRFAILLDHTPFLHAHLPDVDKELREYPVHSDVAIESFLYWSKEHLARKPVISVTHVNIVRNQNPALPDTLIIGRDVFSTHYVDASLSLTALIRGQSGGTNYLVYVNRTEVDVLHGMFGGMIRHSIQGRLKNADVELRDLRQRLEGGTPPEKAN